MKKYKCSICDETFRHYYLYINHLRKLSKTEYKLKESGEKTPHLDLYRKIIKKCSKQVRIALDKDNNV